MRICVCCSTGWSTDQVNQRKLKELVDVSGFVPIMNVTSDAQMCDCIIS